jgi:hypothetical protein
MGKLLGKQKHKALLSVENRVDSVLVVAHLDEPKWQVDLPRADTTEKFD